MTAKVILNPYAGRWKAHKRLSEVETVLQEAQIEYELTITDSPGHGTSLAFQSVLNGFNPIISAGGDGSVSEVVNGMMMAVKDNSEIPMPSLGIIPLGSANDLVINLELPTDLKEAARVIAAGNIRKMDLGLVNDRFFDNNSAVGLEPTITLIQQDIKHIHGVLRYLLATLIGINRNPQWTMHLEWEGGEYIGPITLVTVGNNPLTGGLFYMTPHADPFDGLLTFVYGFMSTRFEILRLLPRTMKRGKGSYIENPNIHEINSTWLRIRSETPTPMHADGEIQSEAIQAVEYRVISGCLPLLMK
jgi:diacylglycerol kinase (ATP)